MANEKMENIKNLGQNPRTKMVLILTVSAVAIALIIGKMATSSKASRPADLEAQVSVGSAPQVQSLPGTSTSSQHNELVKQANEQAASQALATGGSSIPRLTGQTDKAKNPFDLVEKAPDQQAPEIRLEKQQPAPQLRQTPQRPAEKSQDLVKQEESMAAAMTGLLNAWAPVGQSMEVDHTGQMKPTMLAAQAQGQAAGDPVSNAEVKAGAPVQAADVKAGAILNAVAITAVNSDEPGPVLAEVVSGPYQGARLLGSFTRPDTSETVVLQFKMISIKNASQSYPITAFAVNPDTARTALASDVDHHYMQRYGLLFASAFVKGYGQALANSGQTVTSATGAGGVASTTQYPVLNAQDKALVALGQVGADLSDVMKKNAKRPITVTLNAGTPMGILFMTDAVFSSKK